jgi:hypothetical protein
LSPDAFADEVVVAERLRLHLRAVVLKEGLDRRPDPGKEIGVLHDHRLRRGLLPPPRVRPLSPKFVLGRMDHFPPVAVEEPGVLGFLVDLSGDVGMVFGIVKRYRERPEVVGNGLLHGCETLQRQDEPFEGDFPELVDHLADPAVVLAEIGLV